ncbi:hypothetical protein [Nocardia sp. BMG111209]|uniref:hypothetical protein n=1 Tax=Nocardia sp. BMG111209 TaxID=1160137 RepID=UPI0012DEFD84|nr:hypothetical protein [Nocardia sp. BMG111209]
MSQVNLDRIRLRRAAYIAVAFGVLALVATGPLHRLLLGVFLCVGLGLGWLNATLTYRTVTRITRSETPSKQALLATTAFRLLGLTALAIVVGILARPNGIGIFFGVAVFQVIMVLQTVVPELKALRELS